MAAKLHCPLHSLIGCGQSCRNKNHTGEVQHGNECLGQFLPANENAAKAVHSVCIGPHSRNRWYAEMLEQMPVAFSAFHWHPVRSTNKIALTAALSGTRGLWHPSGWGFRGGSKRLHAQSQCLTDVPAIIFADQSHGDLLLIGLR